MKLKKYKHKVQYYETDQMKIVHHSNYIRWYEEARSDFLEQINCSYESIEEAGIISPVIAVTCEYRNMTRYGETVEIVPKVLSFNGIKFELSYEIRNVETGELKVTGTSKHCFLNKEGRPISLKRSAPEFFEKLERAKNFDYDS